MSNELQKNEQVDAARVLRDWMNRNIPREDIDGMSPEDAAKFVELQMGYTPIVLERWSGEHWDIPVPCKVITDGKKYAAVWERWMLNGRNGGRDFQNLLDEQHMEARARYLLLRGYFYRHFDRYSYPEQRKIIAWYFGGVMWRPAEGSDLHRLMFAEQKNVEPVKAEGT